MVYFYYGENLYSLEEKLAVFKERYLAKFPSGLNFIKIDLSEDDIESLKSVVKTHSMFEEKKLVFLSHAFALKKDDAEEIIDLIKAEKIIESEEVVILFYERAAGVELTKKQKKLFTFLTTKTKAQEFKKLGPYETVKWLEKEIQKRNGKVSTQAIRVLIDKVGEDNIRLVSELEKLILFKKPDTVEVADVDLLVKSNIETNIFKTIEALAKKDRKGALENLQDHKQKGDDPVAILSMFTYQLRVLLLLKEAGSEEQGNIARVFKIHPYVIKKNLGWARNFSLSELTKTYNLLADADIALKTGKKEGQEALEDFINLSLQT